jgi:transmembrane sensor
MTEQTIDDLIRKYAEGTASPEEVERLMTWYRSAPQGEVPWPATATDEKEAVYSRMLQRLQRDTLPGKGRLVKLTWLRVAAVLLLFVGAAAGLLLLKPGAPEVLAHTNTTGTVQLLRLPDSSRVWLAAGTHIQYNKNFSRQRQIVLDGEAFFDVAHDPSHPFVVGGGKLEITVLGTRFNVRSYSNAGRTTVSLLSGRVQVSEEGRELAVLTPAQELVWDSTGQKATLNKADTAAVAAWREGRLQFSGQPLGEVVHTLERWYGRPIVLGTPGIEHCRYYMSFDSRQPLDTTLSLLSQITDMQYRNENQTIVITGKPCNEPTNL